MQQIRVRGIWFFPAFCTPGKACGGGAALQAPAVKRAAPPERKGRAFCGKRPKPLSGKIQLLLQPQLPLFMYMNTKSRRMIQIQLQESEPEQLLHIKEPPDKIT